MLVGVDIETKDIVQGGRKTDLDIISVSVVTPRGKSIYTSFWDEEESPKKLNELLKEHTFCFHNGNFDVPILRANGVDIPLNMPGDIKWHDSMCLSYVIYPDSMEKHSLRELAPLVDMEKLIMPSAVNKEKFLEYNKTDALICVKLVVYFLDLLDTMPEAEMYYSHIELPYGELISEMENNGMYVDMQVFREVQFEYEARVAELRNDINVEVGTIPGRTITYNTKKYSHHEKKMIGGKMVNVPIYVGHHAGNYDRCEVDFINLNSSQQVADAFVRLGWKPTSFTPSGKVKCDNKTIEGLASKYPLAGKIIEHNKYQGMLTKFFNVIEKHNKNGRVFGSLNQFQTRTRRLSSSEPNLQNIPARDERGATIRRMFVPPDGYDLVVGDLDRIELVVLAFYLQALTGATTYADAIRNGEDIHSINAEAWGVERKKAKNGIFCFIYGGGRNKLAQTLGVSTKEASAILETMEERVPELFELRDIIEEELVRGKGVMYDFFGGSIVIPEILSDKHGVYASGLRKGLNYVIQGTAGSLFKVLQLKADAELYKLGAYTYHFVRPALVVHDEYLLYVHRDHSKKIADLLTDVFTTNDLLKTDEFYVPVSAKFEVGSNWFDAKGE
jgi:DNA polymerase I-like protein with 3'-5' exonuclease and polymerase domains